MAHGYLTNALRLLSFRETALLLGMDEPELRNFVRLKPEGFPEAIQPGKKIYYRLAELELWLLGTAGGPGHGGAPNVEQVSGELLNKRPRGRPRKNTQKVIDGQEC